MPMRRPHVRCLIPRKIWASSSALKIKRKSALPGRLGT
jgi:hypothetical protein